MSPTPTLPMEGPKETAKEEESYMTTEQNTTEMVTAYTNPKGETENEKNEIQEKENQETLIRFNIFSYLNNIHRTHGLMGDEFSRFLAYVKKRRKKLRKKFLPPSIRTEKSIHKIYPTHIDNKKYLELLILDIEYYRCKYIKIKTDVNNLSACYRAKHHFINHLKKSIKRINFLNSTMKDGIDKSTELQITCFNTFVECSYYIEKHMYKNCLEKALDFAKLTKLIKRTLLNAPIENKKLQTEKKTLEVEKNSANKKNGKEKGSNCTSQESKQFLYFEDEEKLDDMFKYYLSIVNAYKRACVYILKKLGKSKNKEKLEEEDFSKELKEQIEEEQEEEAMHDINKLLGIQLSDTTENIISTKDGKLTLPESDMTLAKIKTIMEEMTPVIKTEIIEQLDIPSDLKNLTANFELISQFLSTYDIDFILHNYGKLFSKYFDCLSIVHEELIKTPHKKSKTSQKDNMNEQMWNKLELHFLREKYCLDVERALLILLKNLCSIYKEDSMKPTKRKDGMESEREQNKTAPENKVPSKENREKDESKRTLLHFRNKKTWNDLIDTFPLLNEGIRYADILKQNVDGLQNMESNELVVNMLQIIKNVKALCSAFYYILVKRNAEAHVLLDQVKTRNYVYLKFKKENLSTSLLRIAILFNRLQDVIHLVNEKYYFRHLSIYSLMLKKKVSPINSFLFHADNSALTPHMSQCSLNPMCVDMASMYNIENFMTHNLQKERGTGIRGLIKSFWKK